MYNNYPTKGYFLHIECTGKHKIHNRSIQMVLAYKKIAVVLFFVSFNHLVLDAEKLDGT